MSSVLSHNPTYKLKTCARCTIVEEKIRSGLSGLCPVSSLQPVSGSGRAPVLVLSLSHHHLVYSGNKQDMSTAASQSKIIMIVQVLSIVMCIFYQICITKDFADNVRVNEHGNIGPRDKMYHYHYNVRAARDIDQQSGEKYFSTIRKIFATTLF